MTKADWLRSEIKKWFEINYLDGDEVQDGQMLASSECLDALVNSRVDFLRSEIERLEEELEIQKAVQEKAKQVVVFGRARVAGMVADKYTRIGKIDALTYIITRYKEELKVLENGVERVKG